MDKRLAFGALIGALVAIAAYVVLAPDTHLYGQPAAAGAHPGQNGTVVLQTSAAGGGEFVVVVDTENQVIGTYHVDAETGNISLRSVRKYRWDLQIDDFNGSDPLSKEVRQRVEQLN